MFLAPCVVSLFWRIQSLPPRAVVWTRYTAWAILGGTVVLCLIYKAYPFLSDEAAKIPLQLAGFSLAFFASLFLLGTRVWAPGETLFPATLGTLLVARLIHSRRTCMSWSCSPGWGPLPTW